MSRPSVAVVMGTRPEAIKLAPVVQALKQRSEYFETVVIATAQHRQMLDQVLSLFGISPDIDLDIMRPDQTLADLTARVLQQMDHVLRQTRPDFLLVQGDTTTVLAAALAAFYQNIPVGHVEAGLRSYSKRNPFPEEISRCLTSTLAEIHFAPTSLARHNLLDAGVPQEKIIVTGNTVVDALFIQLDSRFDIASSPLAGLPLDSHRVLLVTSHRRESWGRDLEDICCALKTLEDRFHDLLIVYPVHMNPQVRATVMAQLSGRKRIVLLEPLDYFTFINLMRRSYLILTDSGGVQEEAPALRKPLLVLRMLTERPEAFMAGLARVVGTGQQAIVEEASRLLLDEEAYRAMTSEFNPYGDGRAAERIVEALWRWSQGQALNLQNDNEFQAPVKDRMDRYVVR